MKVTGSYASVIQGVSQLVPDERRPGQCSKQVNFIADRTAGLARRHGSVMQGERGLGSGDAAARATDALTWRTVPWRQAGGEYTALVRGGTAHGGLPGLQVYRHADRTFLDVVRPAVDPDLDLLWSGGVSAATAVGDYLFMAGHSTVPRASSVDAHAALANAQKSSVWVRGGEFDRRYAVTATKPDGSVVTAAYTTPPAAYPNALDTSHIPWYTENTSVVESGKFLGTVLTSPTAGVIYPSDGSGGMYYDWEVFDEAGTALVNSGSSTGYPLSAGTFTVSNASIPAVYVYAGAVGKSYKVKYRVVLPWSGYQPGGTFIRTLTLPVQQADVLGYIRLPYRCLTGSLTTPGYTENVLGVNTLGPTEFYVSTTATTSTVYFHKSRTGINLALTLYFQKYQTSTNEDYQRLVDDASIAYQRQVTAYSLDAARRTSVEAIAEGLATALTSLGVTVTRVENHLAITATAVSVEDGGDGTNILATDNDVAAIEDLTDRHHIGKLVRVRPRAEGESYYVRADAKAVGDTGFAEVVWVEAPGTVSTVDFALVYAKVSGNAVYVASSAAKLSEILPGTHPEWGKSLAGDLTSSPLPKFIGTKITLLATMQDRLLIGAGGTVSVSGIGDYLQHFPKSVVSVLADSAFEMTPQGTESETLRQTVLYGRDLLVFGDVRQYAISGSSALTPTTAAMPVVSTVPNAAGVAPVAVGGLLFFAGFGERGASVSQMSPSQDPNNPVVRSVSSELTDYLAGTPTEMTRRSNPDTLYLRCAGAPRSVFVFRFEDAGAERVQSAWSSWEFDAALGPLLGMRATAEGVLVFHLREAHGQSWLVADLVSERTALSTLPYLDSMRPLSAVLAGTGTVRTGSGAPRVAAYGASVTRFLIGDSLEDLAQLRLLYGDADLWIGAPQAAEYVPTNPVLRDRNNRPNHTATLTVSSIRLSFSDSSGLVGAVDAVPRTFLLRTAGDPALIGRIPVSDGTQQLAIGKSAKRYELSIQGLKWYPLAITGIEWTGQMFSRNSRV